METDLNVAVKNVRRYQTAKYSLMLIFALSIVNVILSAVEADMYFLFSASLPIFIVGIGQGLVLASGNSMLLAGALVLSLVVVAAYMLCFFLAKKRLGAMIAALVLFAVDALFLLYLLADSLEATLIVDLAIHGFILYELVMGVIGGKALLGLENGVATTPQEIGFLQQQNRTNNISNIFGTDNKQNDQPFAEAADEPVVVQKTDNPFDDPFANVGLDEKKDK